MTLSLSIKNPCFQPCLMDVLQWNSLLHMFRRRKFAKSWFSSSFSFKNPWHERKLRINGWFISKMFQSSLNWPVFWWGHPSSYRYSDLTKHAFDLWAPEPCGITTGAVQHAANFEGIDDCLEKGSGKRRQVCKVRKVHIWHILIYYIIYIYKYMYTYRIAIKYLL